MLSITVGLDEETVAKLVAQFGVSAPSMGFIAWLEFLISPDIQRLFAPYGLASVLVSGWNEPALQKLLQESECGRTK